METTLGFIIIGFVIIIATILIYSKLDKRSDEKIIEKIAEKFGKIEEKLSKVEEMQEEVIDFKDQQYGSVNCYHSPLYYNNPLYFDPLSYEVE